MDEGERERRLRELFERAVALPVGEREALIGPLGDEILGERLRALLAQDQRGTASILRRAPGPLLEPLRRIGHYELLRELGHGSMGTVVLARQVEPVERLVALKMVRGTSDSAEMLRRFHTERQALAVMNHPGIARIFDGGTTEDGVPFFVMEYVRGEPITGYCDRRRLPVESRVELFTKVCAAVQHAHHKGVLHRDLKPSNILVTEDAGSPQPKIIDFGVARATAGLAAHDATSGGTIVGTRAYMSPEQADPQGQDVDSRTDVYSLGVVLHELLTGELPLAPDPERDGVLGFQRRLLEEIPPRASERVRTMPAELRHVHANARACTPIHLVHQLHGDLDWILQCALEKDRNRRYPTASEFAADLQRHRRREPVTAAPPSLRYRVATFIRRNRALVAAAAITLVALVAGMASTTMAMFRERDARAAEARTFAQQARQLRRQTAVADFSEFLLLYGDPGTGGTPPSLRQELDRLSPGIAARLGADPVGEAAVRAAVGRAYLATGEPGKAGQQLARAWQLVSAGGTEDAAFACALLFDLSRARRLAGGPGAGCEELATMLDLGGRALAAAPPGMAEALHELAGLLRRPEVDWAAVQARCSGLLGTVAAMTIASEPARLTGRLLAAVGFRLQAEGQPGSQEFVDRLEAVARQGFGADVDFLHVVARFADSQLQLGRTDKARALASEVLDSMRRLGLGEHWVQLWAERIRGLALCLGDEPAAGEAALVALAQRPVLPEANEHARAAARVLAELCERLTAAGRLETFLAASLQRWLATEPSGPPWWPADTDGLPVAATAAARAAVERSTVGAPSPSLQQLLGSLLLREDRPGAAATALAAALAGLPQPPPELQGDLALARRRLGDSAGEAELIAALQPRTGDDPLLAARRHRALQRITASR
jgi:serine/threonine protein kinase